MNRAEQFVHDRLNDFRNNRDQEEFEHNLALLPAADLDEIATDENRKKAFWINMFNCLVQHDLRYRPELYDHAQIFFGERRFVLAGNGISPDDIRHGILRRSRMRLGFGFIKSVSISDFELRYRLQNNDPRVLFALNTGIADSPPVRFFRTENLENQLNLAAQTFLRAGTDLYPNENKAAVNRLMWQYHGDFGGPGGVLRFLRRYAVIPPEKSPRIVFKNQDNSLNINNFTGE